MLSVKLLYVIKEFLSKKRKESMYHYCIVWSTSVRSYLFPTTTHTYGIIECVPIQPKQQLNMNIFNYTTRNSFPGS